jgi:hypothetical protein
VGFVKVDQIGPDGTLLHEVDTTLTPAAKRDLLIQALPGAVDTRFAGARVVRFEDQVILYAQVTHLGNPWPEFKKRIQIPRRWVEVYSAARVEGLEPRFVGIYHHAGVTIFVDFDPSTYVTRKANNSAAHVATNDLFQAQTKGVFTRIDRNGNQLTSVRADRFAEYLLVGLKDSNPYVEAFEHFNLEFFDNKWIDSIRAGEEMCAALWPDRFQAEWPGFYLEFRVDSFVRRSLEGSFVTFQKDKTKGRFDFDLVFKGPQGVRFYGDLKASDAKTSVAPGNDAADLARCVAKYGRFWYVIFEHETRYSRDNGNVPVIAWNEWRRSRGYVRKGDYDPLSYAKRFKSEVRFVRMKILEVNSANANIVLGVFNQGRQPSGAERAVKVMINKRNIDNFLIYAEDIDD